MKRSDRKLRAGGRLEAIRACFSRPVREGLDSSIGCASNKAVENGDELPSSDDQELIDQELLDQELLDQELM